jgi:hypothetical protein
MGMARPVKTRLRREVAVAVGAQSTERSVRDPWRTELRLNRHSCPDGFGGATPSRAGGPGVGRAVDGLGGEFVYVHTLQHGRCISAGQGSITVQYYAR